MGFKRPLVRIQSLGPRRSKLCIACSDFFKSQSARTPLLLLSKSQPLTLGCDLGPPLCGGSVPLRGNIDFDRPFHVGASYVSLAPTSFYARGKKDVIRPLPCPSFPTATRCAGLAVGRPPCGRHFSPLKCRFYPSLPKRLEIARFQAFFELSRQK